MAKRRKLNQNRFQKPDESNLFSFDPIRRNVLMWGAISGGVGGFFIIQQQVVWQIIGVFAAVLLANYHITKAARYIPRWQAAVLSFIGMALMMFGVILIGALIWGSNLTTGR